MPPRLKPVGALSLGGDLLPPRGRGPPHVDDARRRHAPPPVQNLEIGEPDLHPRPDPRRTVLVTPLQDLLCLRVPVLHRYHRHSSLSLPCVKTKLTERPI